MEKRIRERYSDAILHEAMRRYAIGADHMRLLDGFESFIYEFERDGGRYILRIGHELHRSEGLINGEVDWINYLAEGGASVARAVPSERGRLVEPIDDGQGGCFLTTAFVKASGRPPWEVGWTPTLFERYGLLLGRIHRLSTRYEPADPAWRRPQWDDAPMQVVERHVPASDTMVVERYRQLMARLVAWPRDKGSYGLVHYDAHAGNLLIDAQGTITLFDFDDCAYCWYMYDIAIVLFYMVMGQEDPQGFTRGFMRHFLRGYVQEKSLAAEALEQIPHFLKQREIDLYAVIHRSFDVENLDDPWCSRFMQGRKVRIEADVPFLEFEFSQLAAHI
jgi:Ser/Thr protein kinase RdoA (MazF antagonist)